jgi:hypothetical protein
MHRSAASEFHVMEWGIQGRIFHRVGGVVRFRHSLIQHHPAHIKQRRALLLFT